MRRSEPDWESREGGLDRPGAGTVRASDVWTANYAPCVTSGSDSPRARADLAGQPPVPLRVPRALRFFPVSRYSCAPAPTATHASSALDTESRSNFFAAAAIRVSAAASGIAGFVSPFFALWNRTGLIRATT